jgi:hypothetical protein
MKSSELVSFVVLMGIAFSIMGWYGSRTPVPVQQPAQVEKAFWV